jgi:phage terminase large subunit GpA-like protein
MSVIPCNLGQVLRDAANLLRPPPRLTVSQWADANRVLRSRAAAEPGPYNTARTPYMREIMDALSVFHPARRVVLMKSAQVGATEAGLNWLGYIVCLEPGPCLCVQPTVELAKRFSKQRVDQLRDTPEIARRIAAARARDSDNTMLAKRFAGGIMIITGANSAVGLRSMPARYLFLDEVDAYPSSADEEGDPVALAEARSLTFGHRRKIFLASTPTIQGLSRIEREYLASDQRRYFVPCPHCGFMQTLEFERLRWEKADPTTVHYLCSGCERPIRERHKAEMLARGEWRPTATADDPYTVGYHISALYSPPGWLSWEEIARQWEASLGNDNAIKTFRNTVLGETFVEKGEAPEWERLYERRETWKIGTLPHGPVVLTAGCDIQRDRFEVDVWGWGPGLESWLIDHIIIDGGAGDADAWDRLTELLSRTWKRDDGQELRIARLAIDTGYEASAVYNWARTVGFDVVAPVKGYEGWGRAPVLGPTWVDATHNGRKLKRGARLWTIATSVFKSELYRQLRLIAPTDEALEAGASYPPGYVHLPRGIDGEWVRQLVSEQLVTVQARKRGAPARLEWRKIRERNEALDCRIYARAAAWILGVDRWTEDQWASRALVTSKAPVQRRKTQISSAPDAPRRPADWLGGRRQWL